MTNPLKAKYLVLLAALACGGKKSDKTPTPEPAAPLPTAGLAGQRVALTPLALVAAEDTLHLDVLIGDRRTTLDKCDMRHVARRAPGIAADPDQMGTPFLRAANIVDVPDPLRYQLRTLMGLVGGRYVLVPAGLVFRRTLGRQDGRGATAEISFVLIDSRVGRIGWRTIARGDGDDPWMALTRAVKSLTPGLP